MGSIGTERQQRGNPAWAGGGLVFNCTGSWAIAILRPSFALSQGPAGENSVL